MFWVENACGSGKAPEEERSRGPGATDESCVHGDRFNPKTCYLLPYPHAGLYPRAAGVRALGTEGHGVKGMSRGGVLGRRHGMGGRRTKGAVPGRGQRVGVTGWGSQCWGLRVTALRVILRAGVTEPRVMSRDVGDVMRSC